VIAHGFSLEAVPASSAAAGKAEIAAGRRHDQTATVPGVSALSNDQLKAATPADFNNLFESNNANGPRVLARDRERNQFRRLRSIGGAQPSQSLNDDVRFRVGTST
jgi:hypothetical protein